MLRISWTSQNQRRQFVEGGQKTKTINYFRLRQLHFFGHVVRKEEMEKLFVTEKIVGKGTEEDNS